MPKKNKRTLNPWNRRLFDVAGSQGWTEKELCKNLGYSCHESLKRVLEGATPSVRFLLALQKLETAYEGEIKTFIYQQRPFKKYRRRRMETGSPVPIRPQDIAEVGVVAPVGTPSKAAIRAEQKRARKKALRLAKRRVRDAKNRKKEARRSEAVRYKLWKLAKRNKK